MRVRIRILVPALLLSLLALPAGVLVARVFLMPEQALERQFPGARVARQAFYLSETEERELAAACGQARPGRLHSIYVARRNGQLAGFGFFDTHRVRTKDQTLFIAIDAAGRLQHVDLVSFFEPEEYIAPARWLRLFEGKTLADALRPGVDLPAITGATLTTRSSASAVRRALWLQDRFTKREANQR